MPATYIITTTLTGKESRTISTQSHAEARNICSMLVWAHAPDNSAAVPEAWRMTRRTCHVRIRKVLYQPEAAGHFHL